MPEIFYFKKKDKRKSIFFLVCFGLGGCQNMHLPFPLHKKPKPQPVEKTHNADQFAPGKFSPSCRPGEISALDGNILSVGMRMVSDGKWCALEMEKDEGGNYSSFGVPVSPEHGKAYLYDGGDGVTYVAYRADEGYKGKDHFRIFLIPGNDRPRRNVEIRVDVSTPDSHEAVQNPS